MLLSFNWLRQFISNFSVSPEELAEKLKMSTVEVEGIKKQGELLDNMVVGKVLKCEKHPNADKLKVCQVDNGADIDLTPTLSLKGEGVRGGTVQVVCGGSNVREGMLVALAKVGAKVRWHGEGKPVELKPTKIRGVESHGMICASTEIGLEGMFPLKDEKEILDLTPTLSLKGEGVIGKPLAEVLGLNDAVFEIDNKSLSNRPDLWGHYGMAREVSALFVKKLEQYKTKDIKAGKAIKLKVKVEDIKLCPRYMAVAISGVKIAESPEWLKQRLVSVGLRPVNNIVDITNYVMMDLGQPMHAFDAKRIANPKSKTLNLKIIVRRTTDGEVFKTLDGVERRLNSSMLVIANEEKVVALAGVMGGANGEITNDTTTIIYESANFDAATVRKVSAKFGLRTDSSIRFEKNLDPNLCVLALQKAVSLTFELCPEAKVASNVIDEAKFSLPTGPITIPKDIFVQKLGIDIPLKTSTEILERLGFGVKEKGKESLITIPTWRATKDVSIAEDIVEEVARIYGYDKISASLPSFSITPAGLNALQKLERKVREALALGQNYTETYNYSFVSAEQIENLGDFLDRYIELDNPAAKDKPYLRRNLLPNLLSNAAVNLGRYSEVRIFEIGKVFEMEQAGARVKENSDELLPRQDTWLTVLYTNKKVESPYWEARRTLEALMAALGYTWEIMPLDKVCPWERAGRLFVFGVEGKTVGVTHEFNPLIAGKYGVDYPVSAVRINLSALSAVSPAVRKYKTLSQFPEAERDLAILVKKDITYMDIVISLRGVDRLLKKIELFDVYEEESLGAGFKSMALHLVYSHPERTLISEEVDKAQEKVMVILKNKFKASIR